MWEWATPPSWTEIYGGLDGMACMDGDGMVARGYRWERASCKKGKACGERRTLYRAEAMVRVATLFALRETQATLIASVVVEKRGEEGELLADW
jgi:hypothetical protein